MFDNGSTGGVGTSVDDGRPVVDPLVLPDMLFATAQSENMLAAQKVLGASMLSESRFNAELDVSGDVDKAWRIACNEIAVMLTCSRRTAEVHIEIGDALREFLPLTKAAFAAGELDYARVRKIVDGLTGADPEAIAALERRVLASAHRLPPGQLERDIERQLFAYDPDAAAERRRKMLEHRDVRTRADRHGLAQLQATLSATEAVEALGLINEAAGSVCNHDPRNVSTRRADALVALLHGEQGLTCQCGSETCEAVSPAARSTASSRRKPLLHIVCDLATLLGLTSDPASIDGYGPIDPDFARELSADSTWQALFVDFRAQAAGNRPRRQHAPTVLPLVTRRDRPSREPNGCGDRIRAMQRFGRAIPGHRSKIGWARRPARSTSRRADLCSGSGSGRIGAGRRRSLPVPWLFGAREQVPTRPHHRVRSFRSETWRVDHCEQPPMPVSSSPSGEDIQVVDTGDAGGPCHSLDR